jgi:hypothetical protein
LQENLSGFLGTPYGFLIFFVCLWCFICFMISILGGWFSLSRRFRDHSAPYGETKSAGPLFYGVKMRFRVNYGNVIRLTAATDALYISILFLFRIGHPPLCIPWQEIQMRKTKFLWSRFVVLTLGQQERIPMRISERMARKLGILDRVPGGSAFDVEPNFDHLPDNFPDPTARKPN